MPTTADTDLMARLREVVALRPGDLAVVAAGGTLTYAELADRIDGLARTLHHHGVGRGDLIGICLPRRGELLVALLAVWRLGAAFVPMDPVYPPERLHHMASTTGMCAVLTDGTAAPSLFGVPAIRVDESAAEAPEPSPAPRSESGHSDELAYVIFTSGSTGTPLGVQVGRKSLTHLMASLERSGVYPAAGARVAWNASVSFDASVQQWTRVCRGDTIVLLDEEVRRDPQRLAEFLADHGVTDLDVTPSHWQVLRDHVRQPLRLFVGGEPIPPRMWTDLATGDAVRAVNLYGPTECTVDSTAAWITGTRPTIGRALPGVRTYVLGNALEPVRTGELYLAGPGVAHGYRGRPSRTAERFLADPFAGDGSRMYRTGDRVRRSDDGELEFLGRADRQVKIHGFRIEPAEIEAVLATHPGVASAVVVVHDDPHRGRVLVAYCLGAVPAARLREHAAARLPAFMVPAAFVPMRELPRTASGKVDTATLPTPTFEESSEAPGVEDQLPAGPVETLIAQIWAELLGREHVHATDDFFALGGHSLLALHVVAAIKREWGVQLPSTTVYQLPRLRDLARHVAKITACRASAPPLLCSQGRPAVNPS
ncbi:non-ribosomal peptide synthetase [Amycolatopsis sp. lyj-346]|uniref:non-ribosomal peptide synthetase n=1 Tax=Amycolatopsis sp. lyj-346 TaxID=2789289 RepID=UPI00397E6787